LVFGIATIKLVIAEWEFLVMMHQGKYELIVLTIVEILNLTLTKQPLVVLSSDDLL